MMQPIGETTTLLMPAETGQLNADRFRMPESLTALAECLRPQEGGALRKVVSSLADNIPGFLFHLLNILRIQNNTQVLSQRLFYQLFLVTPDFLTPSAENQAAFLTGGLPLIGGSALLAVLMEARNVYNMNRGKSSSVESYFHALFTASMAFIFLSILYGSTDLSFGASVAVFFISALVAAPTIAAIAYHLVFPDTNNRSILGHFNEYAIAMTNVTHLERVLNGIGGLIYAMSAASVLIWEVNREIYERTVAASVHEYAGMAATALVSTMIGAIATTDYPRVFQAFLMTAKFCKDGGMAAAAFSSVFYYLLPNSTKNPTDYLVCWMLYSVAVAAQSALATKYRFIDNHDANQKIEYAIIRAFEKLKAKIAECNPCASVEHHAATEDDLLSPSAVRESIVVRSDDSDDSASIAALGRAGSFAHTSAAVDFNTAANPHDIVHNMS